MTSLLVKLATYIPLLFLLIDSIGNPQTVEKYLLFSSLHFMYGGWVIMILILLRKRPKIFDQGVFTRPLLWLLIVLTILNIAISLWDAVTPQNFIFAKTRLHQYQIGLIQTFLVVTLLLTRSYKWWQTHYQRALFWTPFIIVLWLSIVRLWPNDYFLEIVKEDNLIEKLQVIVLLLGLFSLIIWLIRQYHRPTKLYLLGISIVSMLAFGFVAGEEISWGQRLLGIKTPEFLEIANSQQEITVHNLHSLQGLTETGYRYIGIIGGILPLLLRKNVRMLPPRFLVAYYLIPGVYYSYPLYTGLNRIKEWAEIAELLLYSGLVLWAAREFNPIANKKQSKNE